MNVRTSIEGRSRRRHLTAAGSTMAALLLPATAGECGIGFDAVEIVKKTPDVVDLKPRGRYVAKDIAETAGIRSLLQAPLGFEADLATPDVKFTGAGRAEHKTKGKLRATNTTSDILWKFAQKIGPAVGAIIHPGGAHEKQCYADI